MAQKTELIEIQSIKTKTLKITIQGTTDLVLNKMNDVTTRQLVDIRNNKAKKIEDSNHWEEIITAIHWYSPLPKDTVFSEEKMQELLVFNSPCITAFGLFKSFASAIIDNNISKYSKQFRNTCNILGKGGLIPVRFEEYVLDEKLMSPKKGAPVLARMNRFVNWEATFEIEFMESIWSSEQIVNIVNLAGFGQGIGSGRNSGYGRYRVVAVE